MWSAAGHGQALKGDQPTRSSPDYWVSWTLLSRSIATVDERSSESSDLAPVSDLGTRRSHGDMEPRHQPTAARASATGMDHRVHRYGPHARHGQLATRTPEHQGIAASPVAPRGVASDPASLTRASGPRSRRLTLRRVQRKHTARICCRLRRPSSAPITLSSSSRSRRRAAGLAIGFSFRSQSCQRSSHPPGEASQVHGKPLPKGEMSTNSPPTSVLIDTTFLRSRIRLEGSDAVTESRVGRRRQTGHGRARFRRRDR